MGHDIVAGLPLELGDPVEIDVVGGVAQGGELLLRNAEPELALRLGQRDPHRTPTAIAPLRREDLHHLRRSVALVKSVQRARTVHCRESNSRP